MTKPSRRIALPSVECPGCLNDFAPGAGISAHMRACEHVNPGWRSPGEPKEACPHHAWDEHGRPDPPAGYCGPLCWMRPGGGPENARAPGEAAS